MSPVSNAAARMFMVQCMGGSPGHMAEIPFSPVIKALLDVHDVDTNSWHSTKNTSFAQFLRAVADELDENYFTVVCVEANPVHGTQHFSGHKAASPEEAEKMAIQKAADDWDCGCCDVVVKGVFAGHVSPLEWNDEA